jgi:hypothetical protein
MEGCTSLLTIQRDSYPAIELISGEGMWNQGEIINGIKYCAFPAVETVRGLGEWYYTIFFKGPYPSNSQCPSIDVPVSGPVPVAIFQ